MTRFTLRNRIQNRIHPFYGGDFTGHESRFPIRNRIQTVPGRLLRSRNLTGNQPPAEVVVAEEVEVVEVVAV